jgi:nucleoside-diphosphate-sugar epimerase
MPSGVVVVTGSGGGVGRRLVRHLGQDPSVRRIVAVDRVATVWRDPRVESLRLHLGEASAAAALTGVVRGADAIVHLAFDADTERQTARTQEINLATTRQVLAAASAAGVGHVVALSSATVYGAWANNPVPLTEDAPLRPNPDFAYAVQRAEVEQLLADWVAAAPGRTVAVLRPCVALAESGTGWLARALATAAGRRLGEEDPAWQFLHLDDLAAAIDLARRRRLDGPFNVAPDRWLPGDTVRALAGVPPRPHQPLWIATLAAKVAWRVRRGPIPPGLLPYARFRWVVANDRLRAEGWSPVRTNEQAFVAGIPAPWWTVVSPRRRQELALGAMGVGLVAGLAGALAALRRVMRRWGSRS